MTGTQAGYDTDSSTGWLETHPADVAEIMATLTERIAP
jgi:hypothetical protein